MKTSDKQHGKNLKYLLTLSGIEAKELAMVLKVKVQNVYRFFKQEELSDATISKIADAIKVEEDCIRENIIEQEIHSIISSHKKP